MPDMFVKKDAEISACGQYRYRLSRAWDTAMPQCLFVMLNPSTADADNDDPTIRRCIGFARAFGCGSLSVVNLFAFRATSPTDMKAAEDPVGPKNDTTILEEVIYANGPIICAWGAHGGFRGRDRCVLDIIKQASKTPTALKITKDGFPGHPLYLRSDSTPVELHAEHPTGERS